MSRPIVYLAGPITGTSYGECTDWRKAAKSLFDAVGIDGMSPMRHKDYLSSESKVGDCYNNTILSSQRGITARDRFDTQRADLVLVNMLGAQRPSLGTVLEIAWADSKRIPIVLIMEPEGNVHDHAMIRELCPFRVETIDEGVSTAVKILLP